MTRPVLQAFSPAFASTFSSWLPVALCCMHNIAWRLHVCNVLTVLFSCTCCISSPAYCARGGGCYFSDGMFVPALLDRYVPGRRYLAADLASPVGRAGGGITRFYEAISAVRCASRRAAPGIALHYHRLVDISCASSSYRLTGVCWSNLWRESRNADDNGCG